MKRFCVLTLLLLVSCSALCGEANWPAGLKEIVEAERSFARACAEKGIRDSFLEFFADDAVVFNPHPANGKQVYGSRPRPADPQAVSLKWAPQYGDISAARDLGYLTGPSAWRDNTPQKRPPWYGFYLSVWKRQADGTWKVALDAGTQTPAPTPITNDFTPAPQAGRVQSAAADSARTGLLAAEQDFAQSAAREGATRALQALAHDNIRIHRDGQFPVRGRSRLAAALKNTPVIRSFEAPLKSVIARSGDLGYAYGRYTTAAAPAGEGYYLHIWRRDAGGKWKIVLDSAYPVPPTPKN